MAHNDAFQQLFYVSITCGFDNDVYMHIHDCRVHTCNPLTSHVCLPCDHVGSHW